MDKDKAPYTEAVAAEVNPPEKPAGSPNLWPFQGLPRRKRATFLRMLEPVLPALQGVDVGADGTAGIGAAAALYAAMADLQDALAVVAVNHGAFMAWADKAPDGDLIGLASWYLARFSVGEAEASPS